MKNEHEPNKTNEHEPNTIVLSSIKFYYHLQNSSADFPFFTAVMRLTRVVSSSLTTFTVTNLVIGWNVNLNSLFGWVDVWDITLVRYCSRWVMIRSGRHKILNLGSCRNRKISFPFTSSPEHVRYRWNDKYKIVDCIVED